MKVCNSHPTALRFKNIFGVNKGEFLDWELMLADQGNVHLDPTKIEQRLLIGKEGYDEDMSIRDGLTKIYGKCAADLVESLI